MTRDKINQHIRNLAIKETEQHFRLDTQLGDIVLNVLTAFGQLVFDECNKKHVMDELGVTYEAKWVQVEVILDAVDHALDNEEPSDFEMSFPIVRKAFDLAWFKKHTEATTPADSGGCNYGDCGTRKETA